MSRKLALDVGDARIGIAVSDPLGIIAQPHSSVENRGKATFREIAAIVKAQEADSIIVGLPLELSGAVGDQALKVRTFVHRLRTYFDSENELRSITFIEVDERFTTTAAERFIVGTGRKGADRRGLRDSVAAAIILEAYLNTGRTKADDKT